MTRGKIGRPSTAPRSGERIGMSLRVTPDIKQRLERSALETGRSLSQEAELRLERSFRDDDLLPQLMAAAYGEKLAAVLMIVGAAMAEAGRTAGFQETRTPEGAVEWFDRPVAYDQAAQAAKAVLGTLAPEGDVRPPRGKPVLPLLLFGDSFANTFLSLATGQLEMPTRARWAEVVRSMLGNDLINRIKHRSS
jgi:hypothetical protein